MKNDDYSRRYVTYEGLHGVRDQDITTLIEHLELPRRGTIADLMGGYGAITTHIVRHIQKKNLMIWPVILDSSIEQLNRAKDTIPTTNISYVHEDIRTTTLEDNLLAAAIIKMGIHELPKKDQQLAYNQAWRILKSGGTLLSWHTILDEEEQAVFSSIVRKKDELAGFDGLAKNRYFFTEQEERRYLKDAGFIKTHRIMTSPFPYHTHLRLHTEFGGDEKKLLEYNDYIRNAITPSLKKRWHYEDKGSYLEFTVKQGTVKALKPAKTFK